MRYLISYGSVYGDGAPEFVVEMNGDELVVTASEDWQEYFSGRFGLHLGENSRHEDPFMSFALGASMMDLSVTDDQEEFDKAKPLVEEETRTYSIKGVRDAYGSNR